MNILIKLIFWAIMTCVFLNCSSNCVVSGGDTIVLKKVKTGHDNVYFFCTNFGISGFSRGMLARGEDVKQINECSYFFASSCITDFHCKGDSIIVNILPSDNCDIEIIDSLTKIRVEKNGVISDMVEMRISRSLRSEKKN